MSCCCGCEKYIDEHGSALSLMSRRISGGTAEEMKCFWIDERPDGRWSGCHMRRADRREEEEDGDDMMAHMDMSSAAAMAAAATRG